jgi:hypothetical protein
MQTAASFKAATTLLKTLSVELLSNVVFDLSLTVAKI